MDYEWSSSSASAAAAAEEDEEASSAMFALKLSTSYALPAALKCAMELNLLHLIKKSGPTSAVELSAQITAANPQAHLMIDRILHLLAANNILRCTLQHGHRLYSLAPVCKFLDNSGEAVSFAPLFLLNHDPISMQSWDHLKDAVVEGGVPFNRAHKGMGGFEYAAKDARYSNIFNQAMSQHSTIIMTKILQLYKALRV